MIQMKGYTQAQARLHAIGSTKFSEGLMKQLGTAAVREQKLLVHHHKKTGITEASIHLASVTPTSARTVAGGAAAFLEFGTKAHDITPRVARVLAWAPGAAGGQFRRLSGATRKGVANVAFAMRVHHPGTAADPFMLHGAEVAVSRSGLAARVIEAWDKSA